MVAETPPATASCPGRIDEKDSGDWHRPITLIEWTDVLAAEPETRQWAADTERLVERLRLAVLSQSPQATEIVGQLEDLAAEVYPLADKLGNVTLGCKLRRAGHCLLRRIDVWRQIIADNAPALPPAELPAELPAVDPQRLAECLAEVDAITDDSARGEAWREYLLLDALREWFADRRPQERLPQPLARRVLRRLAETPMSVQQYRFISSKPLVALRTELRRWAVEPVGVSELLQHLEQYECSRLPSDARLLAADCLHLGYSPAADRRQLADRLQAHYRNANLRVVVSEKFLNRLMPERDPEYAQVRDSVLGVPVYGSSLTSTEVKMRLLPHPTRVRLALEINGTVDSLTSSTSGPATFYNNSHSRYVARKPMEVDLRGIRLWPATIKVNNYTRLRELRTDFDDVPMFGMLVQEVARSQHEARQSEARREIERKIARKAKRQVDSEADARLGKVSQRLRQQILDPLYAMSLNPMLVSAQTTERRLTMRLRLAGEDQLGSHTPRPRAPSSSLASIQVHETAINNVLQRLQLAGRKFTIPELSQHVARRLGRANLSAEKDAWQTDPAQNQVTITFAEKDPVIVHLKDGRITLVLSLAKLSKSPRRWKDFQVFAYYEPQLDGRSPVLARQGIIHLKGERLGTASQIILRGIFTRIFAKQRPVSLMPGRLATDPKLSDLTVTQFIIDDGWIGAALGPKRIATRPAEPLR